MTDLKPRSETIRHDDYEAVGERLSTAEAMRRLADGEVLLSTSEGRRAVYALAGNELFYVPSAGVVHPGVVFVPSYAYFATHRKITPRRKVTRKEGLRAMVDGYMVWTEDGRKWEFNESHGAPSHEFEEGHFVLGIPKEVDCFYLDPPEKVEGRMKLPHSIEAAARMWREGSFLTDWIVGVLEKVDGSETIRVTVEVVP